MDITPTHNLTNDMTPHAPKLNDIFNQIHVINLKRRPDKLDLMKFKLDKLGIKYNVFEAIDGLDRKYMELCDQILEKNTNNLTKGSIGLLLTYHKLLQEVITHNYPNVLFLEDDCNFIKDFDNNTSKIQQIKCNSECDVIYLGANQIFFDRDQQHQMLNGFYTLSTHPMAKTFGTYAIAFNLEFCHKLFKSLNTDLMSEFHNLKPIDVYIHQFCNTHSIKTIIMFPFLVMPDVTDSDINTGRDQKSFCLARKYKIDNFNYLSVRTLNFIRSFLDSHRISLKHILWGINKFDKLGNIKYCLNAVTSTLDDARVKEFNDNFDLILEYLVLDSSKRVNISELFELIEGSDTKFVFIIPSFNNKDNYSINLDSVIKQDYPNYLYRIIYIDDQSTDSTYELVKHKIDTENLSNQFCLIQQQIKGGQCVGRYMGYHQTYDSEVIVFLDGDDWLSSVDVLNTLNDLYVNHHVVSTYGSFYIYHSDKIPKQIQSYGSIQGTRVYPDNIIQNKGYRNYDWICGHLRTTYSYIVKNIGLRDLIHSDGLFYKVATDRAEMIPILEMSYMNHLNTQTGLCVYNKVNSEIYNTSYYRSQSDNYMSTYRKQVVQHQNSRKIYDTFIYSPIRLANNKAYTVCKLPTNSHETDELLKLINRTKVLIATNEILNPIIYNYITHDTSYVAFKLDVNQHIQLQNIRDLPCVYNTQGIESVDHVSNGIVICKIFK